MRRLHVSAYLDNCQEVYMSAYVVQYNAVQYDITVHFQFSGMYLYVGPMYVDAFLPFLPADESRLEFRNIVFCSEYWRMDRVQSYSDTECILPSLYTCNC
jgi:hypothetical protein